MKDRLELEVEAIMTIKCYWHLGLAFRRGFPGALSL